MKKILLLPVCLLLSAALFAADENRYEAWYISLSKDTSFGHIIVRNPDSLYFSILFESNDGTTRQFVPSQVKRFGINIMETWKIFTVLDLGEPSCLRDSSTLIFAQVLNEEPRVRYYKYNYYKTNPGKYNNDVYVQGDRTLITEHCLMKTGKVLRIQTNSLFNNTKKQLRSFFGDCNTAVASVKQLKNITEQLPLIVKQYNRCKT